MTFFSAKPLDAPAGWIWTGNLRSMLAGPRRGYGMREPVPIVDIDLLIEDAAEESRYIPALESGLTPRHSDTDALEPGLAAGSSGASRIPARRQRDASRASEDCGGERKPL
jgi:hypothetical protein